MALLTDVDTIQEFTNILVLDFGRLLDQSGWNREENLCKQVSLTIVTIHIILKDYWAVIGQIQLGVKIKTMSSVSRSNS